MFLSNVKFLVKSTISSTQGTGTTFNISEDFETGTHIESTSPLSIVLKTTTQIERMTITATGGVATIVQRGLTQADTKIEDNSLKRIWNDGTIGYVTAFASDLLDIDKSSGTTTLSNDITFTGDNTHSGDENFTGTLKIPTFVDETARDLVYTSPVTGDKCIIVGIGEQYYEGGAWNTLGVGSPTPNASETVAGKVEIATNSEMDAGTDTGETGALLVGTPSQFQRKEFLEKLNTTGLTENTSINNDDLFVIYDSVNLQNRKIKKSNVIPKTIGGDGSDGALSVSAGTTTLNMVASENSTGFIEKNYSSISITGGTLTFGNLQTNGNIAYIKCQGDFTMSGGTISADAMGGMGGSGSTGTGTDGGRGKLFNFPIFTDYANKGVGGVRGSPLTGPAGGAGKNLYFKTSQNYDILFGGGGGGQGGRGGDTQSAFGGIGGRGGGVLIIEVGGKINFTAGTISANGANGSNATGADSGANAGSGGGGGGAGGMIVIFGQKIISNTGTISVNGGNGGNANSNPNGYTPATGGSGGASISAGGKGGNTFRSTTAGGNGADGTSNSYGTGGKGGTGGAGGNNDSGGGGGGGGGAGFKYIQSFT